MDFKAVICFQEKLFKVFMWIHLSEQRISIIKNESIVREAPPGLEVLVFSLILEQNDFVCAWICDSNKRHIQLIYKFG